MICIALQRCLCKCLYVKSESSVVVVVVGGRLFPVLGASKRRKEPGEGHNREGPLALTLMFSRLHRSCCQKHHQSSPSDHIISKSALLLIAAALIQKKGKENTTKDLTPKTSSLISTLSHGD